MNIIKRLGGQIIVGGPREKFMNNNAIFVGDSAGMVKVSIGGKNIIPVGEKTHR